jgi:acyl-CoA synthetase (AMP-forming)/AMP-acid ligase II
MLCFVFMKVGMAAVMLREGVESLDLDGLLSAYNRDLPAYARPVFIRVTKAIPLTVTFKHKKNVLADEGFDVNKYDDKVYMYRNGKFEQLTRNLLQEIVSLSVRL